MTSGGNTGTNGPAPRRAYRAAYAVIIGLILLGTTVNAISLLHDHPTVERWKPFVLEYTSAAISILLIGFVAFMLRKVPPTRVRWRRFIVCHLAATVAYSLIHSVGFTILRIAIYAALRQPPYRSFDPIYEYPKDFVSYVYVSILFWGVGWLTRMRTEGATRLTTVRNDPIIIIRDGSRVLRTPVDEIVAVCSAGNYVEFRLVNDRKHLMRATLTSVAEQLTTQGFLRTHRSWLVNPRYVRALDHEGSGDFCIQLHGAIQAPLSRRFSQALEELRSPRISA